MTIKCFLFGHRLVLCHIVAAPGHKFYPLGQGWAGAHWRCKRGDFDEGWRAGPLTEEGERT